MNALQGQSTSSDGGGRPSVLLGFRARNARSFRDELDLSLLATALSERAVVQSVPWRESGTPLRVLPVVGIFGANASGKSALLKAMHDMRMHVLMSFKHGDPGGDVEGRHPFLLDQNYSNAPTFYEIDLVLHGIRHVYAFEIDNKRVIEERCHWYPKGRPALLFERDGDHVELGSIERTKGRAVTELLRSNALFLSTAASANHAALTPLYQWFSRNLVVAEAGSRHLRQLYTIDMLGNDEHRDRILGLLAAADLGVTGADRRKLDPVFQERLRRAVRILNGLEGEPDSEDGQDFEDLGVVLRHRGADGKDIELEPEDESLGTQVWLGIVGPVVAALSNGAVLLADELDASLHPALAEQLIRLFQDPTSNPCRAQLIFNSHNAALLGDSVGERILGRDQIWFVEKGADGASRLFPVAAFNPRKQESVSRRYLAGRYGAVPIVAHSEFAAAVDAG